MFLVPPRILSSAVPLYSSSITKGSSRPASKSYDFGLIKRQMEEFPLPPLARFSINSLPPPLPFSLAQFNSAFHCTNIQVPKHQRGEVERLERLVNKYERGRIQRIDWLDRLAFTAIDEIKKKEGNKPENSHLSLVVDFCSFDHPVVFQVTICFFSNCFLVETQIA
jgi:hypothetical protein